MNPTNISPDDGTINPANGELATDVIRAKLARLYDDEPDAATELREAEATPQRTHHQQFIHELNNSGKDLAVIQTEWHQYYQALPDDEKHQVWHEFYASQSQLTQQAPAQPDPVKLASHKEQAARSPVVRQMSLDRPKKLRDARTKADVQSAIRNSVSAGGKLQAKHHLQSLLFGLGMGALVLLVFLFGFFNEVVVAPFIQPSRAEASTPLIISGSTVAATAQPQVIIPKINVQIPVDYGQTTIVESDIENGLENGVVHYPTTVKPGENGNAAFFGHSSNNIFNKGKYKFAFVLLHTLVNGDTFYLTRDGKVYAYKVIDRKVVDPSDVSVLGPVAGQTATATLITCDPPGTSLKRLVVVGQQISPDIAANTVAATPSVGVGAPAVATSLPGNGPTLFHRLVKPFLGKLATIAVFGGLLYIAYRWFNHWRQDVIH